MIQKKKTATRNSRHNNNGHRFPKPHLSRRVDMRGEIGHRPQGSQSLLISSNMDLYSTHLSIGQYQGALDVHMDVCKNIHMDIHTYGRLDKMNVYM
jgi:hypothetical protein